MAARLSFGRIFKETTKLFTPASPLLNRAAVRNGNFIHGLCPVFRENLPIASSGSHDILLSKIRSSMDTQDILETVGQHHTIMNERHVLHALRSIFQLQKSQSCSISNGEVVNSAEFRLLANTLRSQIRHLDINELIDVLKHLSFVGVPATSKIVETVLQLISKNINELSLAQITFLDFLIKDFKSTPLVKAIKIALPIVFETHLLTQCDFENINQLNELFIFISRRNVSKKCSRTIIDALTEQRKQIDLKAAKTIIRSYCEMRRHDEKGELLLQHSLDVMTDSANSLSFYDLEVTLTRILSKYVLGYSCFYHEEFLNACGNYIVNKNCTFDQGLWILRKMCRFNHVNIPLLDYLAMQISKEPWVLEGAPAGMLICFVNGLAQADYKPQNWNQIKELVVKSAEAHQDRQELPWLKLVLDMSVMDCWSKLLYEKIFDEEFLNKYLSRDYNRLDKLQLLALHQSASTLAPWTDGPTVPLKILQSAIEINGTHLSNFPLLPALTHGLGDNSYVLKGVYTRLGHFLDYVVAMRKGGFPVAINLGESDQVGSSDQRKYIEDLDLPPDSKIIAVLFIPSSMSSINNERVRGTVRLQVNTIEALGVSVVTILQSVWNSITDLEKIPYLMQAIRQKAEETEQTPVIVPV